MRKLIVAVTFAALLSGCATQAQMRSDRMKAQWKQAIADYEQCEAAKVDPQVKSRLQLVLIDGLLDPKAIEKMSIDRGITEAEKADVLLSRANLMACRKQMLETAGNIHPLLVNLVAETFAENDEWTLKLIKTEVTIGERNQWVNKTNVERQRRIVEVGRTIDKELLVAHQDELRSRATASAALQQWVYQQQRLNQNQQLINAINRPTMTNCHYIGYTLNCTTY